MLSGHPTKNGLMGVRCFQEASAPRGITKGSLPATQGCLGEHSCVDCLSLGDLPKCDFCLAGLGGSGVEECGI